MPRKRTGAEKPPSPTVRDLAECLAAELRSSREYGQPMIYATEFPSGKIRVNVVWDKWDGLALEDRTSTICAPMRWRRAANPPTRSLWPAGLRSPKPMLRGCCRIRFPALRQGDPLSAEPGAPGHVGGRHLDAAESGRPSTAVPHGGGRQGVRAAPGPTLSRKRLTSGSSTGKSRLRISPGRGMGRKWVRSDAVAVRHAVLVVAYAGPALSSGTPLTPAVSTFLTADDTVCGNESASRQNSAYAVPSR